MAVGKGSIKRAAKAVDSTVTAAPAKEVVEAIVEKAPAEEMKQEEEKPAAKKAPAKKPAAKKTPVKKAAAKAEVPDKNAPVAIGKALPPHLL